MGKYDYFDRILWILAEMMDGTENAEFETKITESQWQNMVNDGFGDKKCWIWSKSILVNNDVFWANMRNFVKIWWILAKMFRDFSWCYVIETTPYPCTPCRLVRWLWVSWAFTKYIGLIGWKWSNLHMSLSLSLSLFLWKKFEKVWKK